MELKMEQDFAVDDSSANNFETATAMADGKVASNAKQISLMDALNKVDKKTKNFARKALRPHSLKRPYPFEGHQTQKVRVTSDGLQTNIFHKDNIAPTIVEGKPQGLIKHPVSLLNEQCTNIIFKLQSVTGPSHCPLFTVTVTVDNITYTGHGKSKKEARSDAALNCLNAIKTRQAANQMRSVTKQDFTNDTDAVKVVQASKDPTGAGKKLGPSDSNPEAKASNKQDFGEKTPLKSDQGLKVLSTAANSSVKLSKSPINVLYETYKTVSFECVTNEENGNANQRFKMICSVEEETFEGYGASKKTAKLAAARSALAIIRQRLSEGDPVAIKLAAASNGLLADVNGNPADADERSVLADKIGKLVIDKFTDLMRSDPAHGKRKVLAGVVMTDITDPTSYKVIGVSSGTKCINGDRISAHGLVLNDCHAEVISRRCFMSYLYDQLRMYAESPSPRDDIEESDLEPYVDGQWVGYRLRPTKIVHLYISTAPCGDSRIFSPHEENMDTDRHPNRLARGQLRTKLESGEGTIPVKNAEHCTQTWDGLVEGERLLTMSCSDKVARWNVLGLQGSLLSLFVQPIYLSSVVLGSLLHRPHLTRIFGDIDLKVL